MTARRLSRRDLLSGAAATSLFPLAKHAQAAAMQELAGLSVFGELAQKPGFQAFPYVRVDAPRGGSISQPAFGTFNSLNPYILVGDAAAGMSTLVFDSLMKASLDEPDALYPLVARAVSASPDGRELRFELRKEARFHDGSPLTARDVVFSLETLRTRGSPTIRQGLRDVESVVAEGDQAVVVRLAAKRSRELPLIVARQPIFSAAWFENRIFEEATLEPPLASGPYRVGKFESGRYINYERVRDYWGRDLPVNVGQNNFDIVRYEYFFERPIAFQAFKAGSLLVYEEFTAANWATGYNFPAVDEKRVILEEIPDATISGIQGWVFNTRRRPFDNRKVREAIGFCFDFAWTNKNLMYGAYKRTQSVFENSDMKATGLPDARELALLEPFRGRVPDEVFGEPFLPPDSDGSGQNRALLKMAMDDLVAAGFSRDGASLMMPDGTPFKIEFLDFSSTLQRHTQPFIKNLRLLGIDASQRIVDAAQYQRRVDDFDFDIISGRIVMSHSPGEELRALFGSESAAAHGSRNVAGISDPVVDALIDKALVAKTRQELVTICRAIDRVLRAGRYWIPHWYKASHWLAFWNVFGRPERAPKYNPGIVSTWWWDDEKARRISFSETGFIDR